MLDYTHMIPLSRKIIPLSIDHGPPEGEIFMEIQ
jgi:hypothetical protein